MILLSRLLSVLWVCFIAYWLISATRSKKSVIDHPSWRRGAAIRVFAIVVIILLFQTPIFQHVALGYDLAPHELVGIIGVALCAIGLGFAVWARVHLGRNWGTPMTLKKDPELVTTGPYRLVRHPIYAGMILATLGSSLVDGLWWFVFFIFFLLYFAAYAAREEEKNMTKQFPNEYPAYRKRTKMLIPFIF